MLVLANNSAYSARCLGSENSIQLLDSKRFLRIFSRNTPISSSDRQKRAKITPKPTQDFLTTIF
ncbi:MAG: hypothetical protein D3925_18300 [Candidatus Electrothrix sp. AR5]|nr:hypothetical protein [Candidatus Electrothrix sp. AR5]